VILRLFKKVTGAKAGRKVDKEFDIVTPANQTIVQHLHLPFYLLATRPVASWDFSKIVFKEDSQAYSPSLVFTDSLHTKIELRYHWKNKEKYSVFIPPGTFTDIFGVTNDTVIFNFTSHSEADYGSVLVKLHLADNGPFIIQLVDPDGMKVFRESPVNKDTTINMLNLDPGQYRLKFIHDSNANRKWDSGNYLKKIQPEIVQFFEEPVVVRSNWDVELQMTIPLLIKQ
jgi:hypothetical protein